MLTENDVVKIVCDEFRKRKYSIEQNLSTSQRGIDVIATSNSGRRYFVEAKGATSSKKTSSRYGKEFNLSQVKSHVGVALVAALKVKNDHPNDESIIALPNNNSHRELIKSMRDPILHSGIKVWFVDVNGIDEFV